MLELLKNIIPVSIDILIIVGIIYIILLPFIAAWKLFEKAGIPGWKALIPVYNSYLMFKITGMPVICIIPYIVYIIISCIYTDYSKVPKNILIIIIVLTIIYHIIDIIKQIKLGQVFAKGILFTLGLILFSPIFEIILGMGKSKYQGNYKKDTLKLL